MDNNILKVIADNPALFEVLKEVFRKQFKVEGSVNTQMENNAIGQVVRARLDGLDLLEGAFKEIESCKTVENKPVGENPAR